MLKKFLIRLIACVATLTLGMPAYSDEFTTANFDLVGSRSIEGSGITKKRIERSGLAVKWFTTTAGSVVHSAVTSGDKVIVGDMNGNMYAFNANDGSLIWQTCVETACAGPGFPFAGIIANPVVKGNRVFVGTLSGSMVALDIDSGAVVWKHTPSVNPSVTLFPGFTVPMDSVWGGAIAIGNMIVYALSPADQFGFGVFARGAVLAVDRNTGAEVWRRVLISDVDFAAGSSGAGFWASAPTYSEDLELIYVGTGQDRNPAGGAVGSDSIFAINVSDGALVWQTQVRATDTWNTVLPFDPLQPTDTDFSQSPSVFKIKGKTMVAAGDKRGIFWVLDAHSGAILNNAGTGLDMFGGVLPGPGLTGGFNNDAGFVKQGGSVKHFAVFADQSAALQVVVDTFPDGVCYAAGGGHPNPQVFCPAAPIGSVSVIEGDGSAEICRFSEADTELFSPFHVDGMIFVRGAQKGNLYVVDFSDCSLIETVAVPTGPSGGASISISDGMIFTGGGFFGAPGFTAFGLGN